MVGVPKSRGCENCRKRKKKCGEERPDCSLCITAGWKCPGYPQRWTFITEDSRLAAHYRKKKYVYEYEDIESKRPELDCEWNLQHQKVAQIYPADSRPSNDQCLLVPTSLPDGNDALVTQLLYHMTSSRSKGLLPLATYGSFFQFIPSHLGFNRALDESISCLCGTYSDSLQGNQQPSNLVLQQYSQALHSLQISLDDPDLQYKAETLCASIILHLCELLINGDGGKWQLLAKGTTILIQSRGPERYVSAFDRAMLESQQTTVMAHSVGSLEPCFLIQPEWQSLARNSSPAPTSPQSIAISLRIELCQFLAQLSQLILAFKALRLGTNGPLSGFPVTQHAETVQLLQKAMSLHEGLQTWYNTKLEPCPLFLPQILEEKHIRCLDFQDAAIKTGRGSILVDILICVTNSILLNLEQLISILTQESLGAILLILSTEPTNVQSTPPFSFEQRRQKINASFEFVKKKSSIAAKPLEFGISRLRFFDDIL